MTSALLNALAAEDLPGPGTVFLQLDLRFLAAVRPGDEIEVSAPTGSWHADPASGERHLCIAAGSGITPMLSVASSVLRHPRAQISLLYGNRTSRTVMFAVRSEHAS